MARVTPLVLVFLVAFLGATCKKKKEQLHEDEDLKSVVAADRRIAKEEDDLLTMRGGLQRERATLRDKRAEIQSKRMSLPENDTQGREELEKEESKLANLEASLVQQEVGLNQKLQSLLDEKGGLVDRLAKDKTGSSRDVVATRREYGVALREKDMARREAELARRENALATREQALAERQAKGCPKVATVVQTVVPAAPARGGGESYSRKDVEPVYKAALAAMQTKGILTADLPGGVDRLVTEVRHSVSKNDFVRAKYAADQLLATVRGMKVDREFIGAKIGRLNSAMRTSRPTGDNKAKVAALFQQATAAYGDGRFIEANRQLNRIYGIIH
jgi:hypothetical protein